MLFFYIKEIEVAVTLTDLTLPRYTYFTLARILVYQSSQPRQLVCNT